MKNKATAVVFWLLIILAAACMIWGAVHIQSLDKTELAVYTQSEYDLLLEKYEGAKSDYSEVSRQLAGYMTKYETLVNQLNAARTDISRLQENHGTLTTDMENLQTESANLAQQLTDAKTRAETAESSLRQMNTKYAAAMLDMRKLEKDLAAAMLDMGKLEKDLAAANAKIEELNTFESLAMPVGFHLPESCTAAEVGGWVYISRRDHAAQAVIRQFESEEEMSRSAIVEYLLSLTPAGEEKLAPAVVEFTFEGGAGSRFAMQYEDADGVQMYGEFCIIEIGGEYFCLEVQAAFEQRTDAADMVDVLLEGLYARAE